jgi:hypothetical protein
MHKRSFIRGLSAGIVTKLLCTALIAVALVGMAHLYAVSQNVPNPLRDGRLPPLSMIWGASQILVFVAAGLSGFACAHWSKPGSWSAPITLAVLWLAWSATKVSPAQSIGVVLVLVSISSLGILLGAFLYQRRHEASDA